MKTALLFFSLLFSLLVQAQVQDYAYSPRAHEAKLEFDFHVQFQAHRIELRKEALDQIELQLKYLFSGFSNNNRLATPRLQHEVSNVQTQNLGNNFVLATYHYVGTILIQDGDSNYSFLLPLNPSQVYRKSFIDNGTVSSNPCGDREHPEEEYYWYFLNPMASGCPLKLGVDFDYVHAKLSLLASTTETYPEYERLLNANKEIRVDVLFGMNDNSESTSANTSRDLNASAVRDLRRMLSNAGFSSKVWSASEIKKIYRSSETYKMPYVEELTKTGKTANLKIRIFFGPSTLFEGNAFQSFMSDSMMNANVMIYAGHSGLGEYLDIQKMREVSGQKFEADREKYQIYFFNGCSSYPYYADQYFHLKQSESDPSGTKNLDIITNGLATYFVAISPSNKALISALVDYAQNGRKRSYQEIINAADSGNLINILGDEDNN